MKKNDIPRARKTLYSLGKLHILEAILTSIRCHFWNLNSPFLRSTSGLSTGASLILKFFSISQSFTETSSEESALSEPQLVSI